jgi:septal ring factor EnvC (AmiA/AmiB activator)
MEKIPSMMNRMKSCWCGGAAVSAGFLLISCGDDPQLVAKHESQKIELARLQEELAVTEREIKNLPPDVSKELVELRAQVDAQIEEVTRLESEIARLEASRDELKEQYDQYRQKYPIP